LETASLENQKGRASNDLRAADPVDRLHAAPDVLDNQPDREHERVAPPRRTQRQALKGRAMIRRWVALGIAEAQEGFRRVKGYIHMPSLVAALRPAGPTVASERRVA
jgi:hypothetical protein